MNFAWGFWFLGLLYDVIYTLIWRDEISIGVELGVHAGAAGTKQQHWAWEAFVYQVLSLVWPAWCVLQIIGDCLKKTIRLCRVYTN